MSAAAASDVDGVKWDPKTGELSYEFWSAQREALDAANSGKWDIVAGLGGYGSGKTVMGARWVITNALAEPGSKHLAMGIDFRKAEETTFETLFKQLPGEGTHLLTSEINGPERSPIVADYNRERRRLTFINDSIILLGSADYPARHAGDEFGSVWLDEPSHYHPNEKLFFIGLEMLPTRLRSHDRVLCQLWTLTGNGYNAAWKILEEREGRDGNPIGQDVRVVHLPNQDNPYLAEETRERLHRQYAGTAKEEQALYGGFDAAEGLVYDVSRERQIIPADALGETLPPLDEDYHLYGYDSGFRDPRVLLHLRRTVGDQDLIVVDEFYRRGSHLDAAIDWLDGKPPGVMACEHEPEEIERFDDETDHDPIEANKELEPGIAEVSQRFNPRDPTTGERLDDQYIGLYVTDRCENTVNELFSYKEEEIGGTDVDDHAMDALRYAVKAVADGEDTPGGMGFSTLSLDHD